MVTPGTIKLGFVSNAITQYYQHGTTFTTAKGMVLNSISFNNVDTSSQTVKVWFKPTTAAPTVIDEHTFTTLVLPAQTGPVFLHCDYAIYTADQTIFMQASAASKISATLHYRWNVEPTGMRPNVLECGWLGDTATLIYKHNTSFETALGTHIRGISMCNTGDSDLYTRIWFTPGDVTPTADDVNLYGPFLVLQGGVNFIDFDYLIKDSNASIFMKADTANKISARIHYSREIPIT